MYIPCNSKQFDIESKRIQDWLSDPEADRVVKRRREIQYCYGHGTKKNITPHRTELKEFSPIAANRLRRYIDNFYVDFTGMVTLTYGEVFPWDGREVKKHLRALFERLRRLKVESGTVFESTWLKKFSLVWWIEYQERGAPHIHALVTGWISKTWLSEAWSQISGAPAATSTRVEKLKDADAAGSYAAKYAAKAEQHTVPADFTNCGRHWGCVGARPGEGQSRVPRLSAATPARAAGLVRACARAQMQARAWNKDVKERLSKGDGTAEPGYLLDMPPIYLEGRCLWTVRIYEHDGGYSMYGNEREIQLLWDYLQEKCAFTVRTGEVGASTQQKT